jgi:hypothetical protein
MEAAGAAPIRLEDWIAAVEKELRAEGITFDSREGFQFVETLPNVEKLTRFAHIDYPVPVAYYAIDDGIFVLPATEVLVQLEGVLSRSVSF